MSPDINDCQLGGNNYNDLELGAGALDQGLGFGLGYLDGNTQPGTMLGYSQGAEYVCPACRGRQFSEKDGGATLICKGCGHVLVDHVEGVVRDFDQILDGRGARQRGVRAGGRMDVKNNRLAVDGEDDLLDRKLGQ